MRIIITTDTLASVHVCISPWDGVPVTYTPAGVGKHLSTGNLGKGSLGPADLVQDGHAEPPAQRCSSPWELREVRAGLGLQEATNTRRLHWTHASFSKQGANPVLNAGGGSVQCAPGGAG